MFGTWPEKGWRMHCGRERRDREAADGDLRMADDEGGRAVYQDGQPKTSRRERDAAPAPSIKARTIVSHFWARLKKVGSKREKNPGKSKPDFRHGAQGRNRIVSYLIEIALFFER